MMHEILQLRYERKDRGISVTTEASLLTLASFSVNVLEREYWRLKCQKNGNSRMRLRQSRT